MRSLRSLLLLVAIIALGVEWSLAIPAFARKYDTSCLTCHAPFPRLKAYGEESVLAQHIAPPCNWKLRQTSSWLNFYLGRDHSAKRLGINPPAPKK